MLANSISVCLSIVVPITPRRHCFWKEWNYEGIYCIACFLGCPVRNRHLVATSLAGGCLFHATRQRRRRFEAAGDQRRRTLCAVREHGEQPGADHQQLAVPAPLVTALKSISRPRQQHDRAGQHQSGGDGRRGPRMPCRRVFRPMASFCCLKAPPAIWSPVTRTTPAMCLSAISSTGRPCSISVNTNSVCGNGDLATIPAMTPDGRYVAFTSAATDLVAGDTNGIPDVFMRDLQSGTPGLVSVGASQTIPRVPPLFASLSDTRRSRRTVVTSPFTVRPPISCRE